MKYKTIITGFFIAIFVSFAVGCNISCDDCLEMTVKSVKVLDSTGKNLLFGNDYLYDPDSVFMNNSDHEPIFLWIDKNSETIQFNLEDHFSEYYLYLTDSVIDTISFSLSQRKSTQCCGNMTISTRTFLNGKEVTNSDLITIVK